MDPEVTTQNPQNPPFLFYRRLVAYVVYTICGLIFMWSFVSITVETFWPSFRPQIPQEERVLSPADKPQPPKSTP
ncbi:hypothetical protein KKF84_15070 [Myxococcota bacterium]|nr:hypothetical protein [Myxococcota bacterium]